jgi:hypothetical protein
MTDMKEIHNDFMIIPVLAFSLKIKGKRRHKIRVPYGMVWYGMVWYGMV